MIDDLLENINSNVRVSDRMIELFQKLSEQLKSYNGRLMYGYLPKAIKETVNEIAGELAKDSNIKNLYAKWNKINREKLSLYYDNKKQIYLLKITRNFAVLRITS